MLSLRHLAAASVFAVCAFAPPSASAQYYYAQPPGPPPAGYNRVIVTDAPLPPQQPHLGRPYPYLGTGQPGYAPAPYAPRPRFTQRRHKPVAIKSVKQKAQQAALIEELKKRPRIKKVTIEDTTATVSPPVNARGKKASLGDGKERGLERVIRAEAEVRIIGNDQMSIRLFRKGQPPRASAE